MGHNLAIAKTDSQYHLVLNPDVGVSPAAISEALKYFSSTPDCGLIAPAAFWPDGQRLYLCKSYPSFLDLALRGIDSRRLRKHFRDRLARYEMKEMVDAGKIYMDPKIISGCFMFFRTDVLKALGGFDPRFFLYFEDYDISLRAAEITHIAYLPSVRIVHYGGYAARKGIRHISSFAWSAVQFFNKHGWRWY
jgi:GT2 family glycosyltransferase